MSVVSASDQTARDRSSMHGLRSSVCFRESRFVTCVDKPVSFQRYSVRSKTTPATNYTAFRRHVILVP